MSFILSFYTSLSIAHVPLKKNISNVSSRHTALLILCLIFNYRLSTTTIPTATLKKKNFSGVQDLYLKKNSICECLTFFYLE